MQFGWAAQAMFWCCVCVCERECTRVEAPEKTVTVGKFGKRSQSSRHQMTFLKVLTHVLRGAESSDDFLTG